MRFFIIIYAKLQPQWRHQIIKLAKADLVKTYSGAALGWAWAIIKPTVTILVLWFAFSVGLRVSGQVNGCPYILWLISGYVPWFYMQEMISGGAGAVIKYRYLVTKMKFPISTIPTFVGFSKLFVQLFLMVVVIAIFVILGYFPGIYIAQLPIYIVLMVVFFTLWSLFASMLSAMSRDFLNLVKSFVTPIFWLSGIMWDVNKIDIAWINNVLLFNPATFLSSGYRNVFIYKKWIWEDTMSLACFGIMLLLMLILALWAYKRTVKEIPDIL